MNFKILATIVAFFALSFSAFADKSDEIIEKSIKATGGKEKIANLMSWTFSSTINAVAQNMELSVDFWYKKPDKMRMVTKVPAMSIEMDGGTDGKTFWVKQPGDSVRKAVPEMMQGQVQGQLEFYKTMLSAPMLDFKEKNITLKYKGLEDIDEKKCNVLIAIDKDSSESFIYFDAISNLMYCTKQIIGSGEQSASMEMKIMEYQRVDGMTLPKRIEVYQNNTVQAKISLSAIKFNEKMEDSDFNAN